MAIYIFTAKETGSFKKKIKCNNSLKQFSITNKIVKIEN